MKLHLLRTLVLLLIPGAVLALMAGWVVLHRGQARTPQGAVVAKLTRDIVWPWQETQLNVVVEPDQIAPGDVKLDDVDVVLVLDRSGSMVDGPVEAVKDAAVTLVEMLAGEEVRFGVVEFNERAAVVHEMTGDAGSLANAINGIHADGGTEFGGALRRAEGILRDDGRAGAKSAIIFFSDGETQGDPGALAGRMHRSGIAIYTIGFGQTVNGEQLRAIAGDGTASPNYAMYREAPTPGELGALFLGVGSELAEAVMTGLSVEIGVGPRAMKLKDQDYRFLNEVDARRGRAVWGVPVLYHRPARLQVDVDARAGGVYRVPTKPLKLQYYSEQVELKELAANTRPWALFITWPLLFWLFLPAIAYLILALLDHLFTPRREREVVRGSSDVAVPPLGATPLPRLPAEGAHRPEATPTLVVGMGASGRCVLTQFKDLVVDTFDENQTPRVILRQLDLHRNDYHGPGAKRVRFAGTELTENEIVLLPQEACDLVAVVEGAERAADYEPWFERRRYENLPAGKLNLADGAHGESALARRGLWKDLERGIGGESPSEIGVELMGSLDALMGAEAPDGLRQIVLVFSPEEAVGAGWSHDVAHILRAEVRRRQGGDPGYAPPEILALILSHRESSGADWLYEERAGHNRAGWLREADRLALSGRYPMPVLLPGMSAGQPEHRLSDEQPLDGKLLIERAGVPEAGLYPEAADFLVGLTNQAVRGPLGGRLRSDLLEHEVRLNLQARTSYTSVGARSVAWHVSGLVERLFLRFLQHLLGLVVCHRGEPLSRAVDSGWRLRRPDAGRLEEAAQAFQAALHRQSSLEAVHALATEAWPIEAMGPGISEAGDDGEADPEWAEEVSAALAAGLGVLCKGRFGLADVAFLLSDGVGRLRAGGLARPGSRRAEFMAICEGAALHAEAWIFALLGPGSIPEPMTPELERPKDAGMIEKAARDLAELEAGSKSRSDETPWLFLGEDEGNPSLAEEKIYDLWLERWLETKDWAEALEERVGLDVVRGRDRGLLPSFALALIGEKRVRVPLGRHQQFEETLRAFSEEWLAPLRDLSIFEKLAGEDAQQWQRLAAQLHARDVAQLFQDDKVQQRNYLVLPSKPGLEGKDAVMARANLVAAVKARRELGHHLATVPTRDLRTVRKISVLAGGSSDDLRAWDGAARYSQGPEAFIESLWQEARRRAPEALPMKASPTLAVLGCVPERLEAFAHSWGAGKIVRVEGRWKIESGELAPIILDRSVSSIFEVAYAFALGAAAHVRTDAPVASAEPLEPARADELREVVTKWRRGELAAEGSLDEPLLLLLAVYFESLWSQP